MRAIGLANLAKAHALAQQVRIELGVNSNHTLVKEYAKDEKPDISEALSRFKARRALRPRTERYLDSIESVRDFEKVRKEHPRWALEFAADRVWGKPKSNDAAGQGSQRIDVKALVLVLSGGQGAGPQDLGIDGQGLTFLPSITESTGNPQEEAKQVIEDSEESPDTSKA